MRPVGRHNRSSVLLDGYACFLIPAITLLFAGRTAWLGTNFSVLAVMGEGRYRGFLLWGLSAGAYFLVMLIRLADTMPGTGRRAARYGVILGACACLEYALLVPYVPEQFPDYARLHVALAFSAGVLAMLVLLELLLTLWYGDRRRYGGLLWGWFAIAAGSVALLMLVGKVTSGLEVFFTLSSVLLVRSLWIKRKNQLGLA